MNFSKFLIFHKKWWVSWKYYFYRNLRKFRFWDLKVPIKHCVYNGIWGVGRKGWKSAKSEEFLKILGVFKILHFLRNNSLFALFCSSAPPGPQNLIDTFEYGAFWDPENGKYIFAKIHFLRHSTLFAVFHFLGIHGIVLNSSGFRKKWKVGLRLRCAETHRQRTDSAGAPPPPLTQEILIPWTGAAPPLQYIPVHEIRDNIISAIFMDRNIYIISQFGNVFSVQMFLFEQKKVVHMGI